MKAIISFWKNNQGVLAIPLVIFLLYIGSMYIYPIFRLYDDWEYLQKVWARWQSLNAAMIALITTAFAIIVSIDIHKKNIKHEKGQKEEERQRRFIASLPFLPQELSHLTEYCRNSMKLYYESWQRVQDQSDRCRTRLKTSIPPLDSSHIEAFKECIYYADQDVGKTLANILRGLQVHHSRMKQVSESFDPGSGHIVLPKNIMNNLHIIGEIQSLINRLFPFSRGEFLNVTDEEVEFDSSPLTWEDFRTAFSGESFSIPDIKELQDYIERKIAGKGTHS